jgi:hypothetical protein
MSKPFSYALGSPNSDEISAFFRGWYQKVVHGRALTAVLPAAPHLEGARVEHGEPADAGAIPVTQHADHDVVARHAVDGVRPRVTRLVGELLRLDDLLDARPPGVVRDVEDVDPRRAEARRDQVRAIRSVARGAAAVPAEMMELVTDVRHRRLVHDPARLGVDHGEEVGRPRARAPVEARHVEQVLRRCLRRLLRRGVERPGGAVLAGVAHREPPSRASAAAPRRTTPFLTHSNVLCMAPPCGCVGGRSQPAVSRTFRRAF